jgi:hypothetical protein
MHHLRQLSRRLVGPASAVVAVLAPAVLAAGPAQAAAAAPAHPVSVAVVTCSAANQACPLDSSWGG